MSANSTIFAVRKRRELSSAGSEHLPYKQGVTGSNPVAPTTTRHMAGVFFTLDACIRITDPFPRGCVRGENS